jgi:hypothetical protein
MEHFNRSFKIAEFYAEINYVEKLAKKSKKKTTKRKRWKKGIFSLVLLSVKVLGC